MVDHRSLVALMRSCSRGLPSGRELTGCLPLTSIGFDVSVVRDLRPPSAPAAPWCCRDPLALLDARRWPADRAQPGVDPRRTVPSLVARAGTPCASGCRGCALILAGGEALPPATSTASLGSAPDRSTATARPRTTVYSTSTAAADARRARGAHRPADDRTTGVHVLDRAAEPVPVGRARRALPRRRGAGARLPRPPGADRRALRARSVRGRPGRAPLPHRRPRPLAAGRQARVPRPRRPPGEDARLPHRAGRDRGGARPPSGGARGGGGRRATTAAGAAAGGLRRRRRRRAATAGGAARLAHCARACRSTWCRRPSSPCGAAADAQRQGRSPGPARAGASAAPELEAAYAAPRSELERDHRRGLAARCSAVERSASTTTSSTSAATRCCWPASTPGCARCSAATSRWSSCSSIRPSARWRRRSRRRRRRARPRGAPAGGRRRGRPARLERGPRRDRHRRHGRPVPRRRGRRRSSGDNLRGGVESIHFFTDEELLAAGVDPALLGEPRLRQGRGSSADDRPVRRRVLRPTPARGRADRPAAAAVPGVRLGGAGARRLRPGGRPGRSACTPARA